MIFVISGRRHGGNHLSDGVEGDGDGTGFPLRGNDPGADGNDEREPAREISDGRALQSPLPVL